MWGPINLILKQAIIDIVARPAEEKEAKVRQPAKVDTANQSSGGGGKRKPRTCTKYQKGVCTEAHSHYIGRWLYHHSCSICLKQTSELVNHPTQDCPRQSQTTASPAPKNPQRAAGGFWGRPWRWGVAHTFYLRVSWVSIRFSRRRMTTDLKRTTRAIYAHTQVTIYPALTRTGRGIPDTFMTERLEIKRWPRVH